jgi:hypothetical protein
MKGAEARPLLHRPRHPRRISGTAATGDARVKEVHAIELISA